MTNVTASPPTAARFFLFGATMIYLVQFSSLWIWPADAGAGIIDADNTKPLGFVFNLLVYAVTLILLCRRVLLSDPMLLPRALAVFLPLMVWALVCCFLGFQLTASLRTWTIWSLTFVAGALIGLEVERPTLLRWFLLYATAALWGSILWSVAVPSFGVQQGFWRGLFLQKNYLGWFAALTLVAILSGPVRRNRVLVMAAGPAAALSLVFSGAKTALVSAAGVAVYQALLRVRHRTAEGRFVAILMLMVVCAVIPLYGLDLVLELLGKDPTLTGRTVVWNLYLQKALERPIAGFGPGAFDGISDITSSFLQGLEQYGEIRTPHNVYLTYFGDTGLIGVALLIIMLARLTLFQAATDLTYRTRWPALLAFAIVIEGMAEALQGFGNNVVWFLLSVAVASMLPREADIRQPAVPPRRPAPAGIGGRRPATVRTLARGRGAP